MMKKYVVLALAMTAVGCAQSAKKESGMGYQGLGKDSVDQKTLAQYQAPPLNPELSRKIQSYLDIRSPGMGLLSPDKKQLYFSWRVTGTTQVWRLDHPMGFPVQLTGGEDQTSIGNITANGKWLIIRRDRNGEENPGLYLQPAQGGPLKLIQHKDKVQTHFQFVSDDSKYVYFSANDKEPQSFAIYRYEIASEKIETILSQSGYWVIVDHKNDGRLLLAKVITNLDSEIYEYDPKTQKMTTVFGPEEKNDYEIMYGSKEGEYLVTTSRFSDFKNIYSYQDKKWRALTKNTKWDVLGFNVDRQHKHLVYSNNEGGYIRSYFMDGKTYASKKFPSFKNADHVNVGTFSVDGNAIMLGVETAKGPRTSYSYDFKTGKLIQWVLPSQPEVDTSGFASASLEYYEAKDGTKIPMFVRRPAQCLKADKPCPVVVHFHGGPEGQSTPGFSVFSQLFIDEGMIYVEPNVRGSEGYGKKWLDSDNGPLRLNVITDIEDAAKYIKKNWAVGGVSPKVGVFGWSYGGYSTLFAMTKFAGSYDAGVALVGMSNLETFLNNTAPYRRALRISEYGDPVKDKEALVALSPSTYMDKISSPLLIVQGANDPRVPVGEALQMQNSLNKKGIASQLIIFADEGHGTAKRSNQVLEIGHTLNFMKTYLR